MAQLVGRQVRPPRPFGIEARRLDSLPYPFSSATNVFAGCREVLTMGEVKNWASILDEGTRRQAEMLSRAPGIAGHVALMPDAHIGKGATVGSVIPTHLDTIMPAAVGVDIGCGMIAVCLNKARDELPDDLSPLVGLFGRSIPAGVGREHGRKGRGESGRARSGRSQQWFRDNPMPSREGLDVNRAVRQLGTLGSGNHFVEVCVDTVR